MSDQPSSGEPYLRVEDVAERLGLPLSVLMGRVEAGDVPSRREEDADGVHYWLRLGDLGIGAWDDRAGADDDDESAATVGQAIQSSFNPGEPSRLTDAPWSLDGGLPSRWPGMDQHAEQEAEEPAGEASTEDVTRAGVTRQPDWLRTPAEETTAAPDTAEAAPVPAVPAAVAEETDQAGVAPVDAPEEEVPAAQVTPTRLPVPQAAPRLDVLEPSSPRGDLASMSIDARELVAGLLDRWERTLEQRIYAEQRQRFENELTARQSAVKQLQMELHTARAEHAAAQAEKDRQLAEKERELADREREVAEARREVVESTTKRRRWFRRTDV